MDKNPVITALVIALGTVTCIFLLTMLNRQLMVSCKPLAAPDSKPLINANIKWRVSGEEGTDNEACSYYARQKVCETS